MMAPALTTQTANDADGELAAEATPLTAQLFLVLEAGRPRAGGARHTLANTEEVVIGRGSTRAFSRETRGSGRDRLRLSLPSRTLSGVHARLCNHRGHFSLQDLGSTNGTFLNGVRVSDAVLRDRDVIEVGQTFFVFREGLPTPERAPADLEPCADAELGSRTLLPEEADRWDRLLAIARSQIPVLLLGETGTGKELLARAIHRHSARQGALVAVNCGALSATLLESQLFGHGRGSFSGATRDEPGLVRAAHRGTLFLDEVGDMPAGAQVALLRVLQENEVLPVGAARPVSVDVRVVAATHRPVPKLVSTGAFRADLLARLHGHAHTLPALRQRREDLGLLLSDVLRQVDPQQRLQRLSPEVARCMLSSSWPLNVRQLTQAVTRALSLAEDGVVRARDWEPEALPLAWPGDEASADARPKLRSAEDEALRDRLLALLSAERGNVAQVARRMGKARMQVQRWMKRFDVDPAVYRH
jgi:transcriptional regulator of acetoin/glycerol metabolism